MSWRDDYQPGSFRGAGFVTVSHDASGGRRGVTHEYPQRDDPQFEDLGRKAWTRSISCFVIVADYMTARDGLIAALTLRGAGTLIHPFLGSFEAIAQEWSFSESTEQGGMARFEIQFVEPGIVLASAVTTDSAGAARGVASLQSEAAATRFAASFSVAKLPQFSVDGAIANIETFARSALDAGGVLGGAGKILRTFESGIAALEGAVDLVYAPITLARTVTAMVRGVAALGTSPLLRLRALTSMFGRARSYPAVIGATPVRIAERANQEQFGQLVSIVTAAEAVAALSNISFASRDEALAMLAPLVTAFDDVATIYADAGADDAAVSLDALRLVAARDVTARGSSLARLYEHVPLVTLPSLVIAHALYGTEEIEARANEVTERNKVVHPGFVIGGQRLEVRSLDGGGLSNAA